MYGDTSEIFSSRINVARHKIEPEIPKIKRGFLPNLSIKVIAKNPDMN